MRAVEHKGVPKHGLHLESIPEVQLLPGGMWIHLGWNTEARIQACPDRLHLDTLQLYSQSTYCQSNGQGGQVHVSCENAKVPGGISTLLHREIRSQHT